VLGPLPTKAVHYVSIEIFCTSERLRATVLIFHGIINLRDAVIILLTRLEQTVQDLATSHAGLVAALVVGAVLALIVASCCWAVNKCLGRPKKRAARRPPPGNVALEMEPVAAAVVPAPVVPAPQPAPAVPVVAVAAPAPQPVPAPVVAIAAPPPAPAPVVPVHEEVAVQINAVAGALDPAELQAVLAALRAVPRGGPLIPPPPPMGLVLPPLAPPPHISGFSG